MKNGSLSAAAKQLGYTTSGISRSIASLEEELGISLFTRGKKGVELTSEAASFIPIMREFVFQQTSYPQIKMKTLQATSTELLHAMEHHEIDFAIMTYRESDYCFHTIKNDPMVACIPANHPLAKRR